MQYISKLAYAWMAITSDSFCVSCIDSMKLFISNPMKFGMLSSLGGVFVFIGEVFICAASALGGYFLINTDSELIA
jgi:hypothetical protein